MRSSQVTGGQTATAKQYNDLRDDAYASSWLLAHEQTTPGLTLYVEPGVYYNGSTRVEFAGGNSPTFTAPSTNPRIDVLSIDTAGTLVRTAGTEAGSPTVPSFPGGNIPICQVYNRVGQTTIRDVSVSGQGYVYKDVRPFMSNSPQLSNGGIIATAGENITAQDIAFLATQDSRRFAYFDAVTTTETINTNTSFRAQTFTISAGCNRLRRIGFYVNQGSNPAGTLVGRLYATSAGVPVGPSLATIFSNLASQFKGSAIQGDVDLAVTPGDTYAIVLDVSGVTLGGSDTLSYYYGPSGYTGGSRFTGTSLSSWTADTANDYAFFAEFQFENGKVFRYESTTALNTGKLLLSPDSVASGASGVFKEIDGVLGGFSGLTPGTKYYTSTTTYGALSTIATDNILLGVAISATQILIDDSMSREAITLVEFTGLSSANREKGWIAPEDGFVTIENMTSGGTGANINIYRTLNQQPMFSYDSAGSFINYTEVLAVIDQNTAGESQKGSNPIPVCQGDMLMTINDSYGFQTYFTRKK